nr:reverse transcriptase domain-containing protein [Tanacetum cinerariifolium]
MRTRSQSRDNYPQQQASPAIVEPLRIEFPFFEDQSQENPPPEVPMANNRTMAELLQAPTEGYEDAIVIPEITANNFELKHGLINLVQNKQFLGQDKEDPHAHIRNNFSQQEASPVIVEPLRIELPFLEDQFQEDPPPEVLMADNRTMAKLLQAPTEGYEDAIVIPEIAANNFELKHGLINLVQNKQFFGHDKEDPHAHIRYFNKIISTMRVPNVPSSSIKLMIFPLSLEGAARIWLEKEPPRSILTWDDLVSKFINQACPHHGFFELHQLDTLYNALNVNDHDSLNSDAGGNFLDKMHRECLKIIESKSKVRQSRAKAVVAKVNTSSSTLAISSDVAELKDMVRELLLDKKTNPQLQLNLLLLLQLKQLSQIVLLAMVLTRTKIVQLPAETFIETTSKSMCHKPPQPITIEETPVFDLKWLQMKFDLLVFLPFKPIKIIKIISIGGIILIKTEVVNQPPAYQAPTYQAPIPQTQGVSKTDFEIYVKANDAVLRNMQNQGTEVSKDQVQTPSSQSTALVQPSVAQPETQTPISEQVVALVSALMPNLKPSIIYPSSDFLLFEEANVFLGLEDDPNSPEFNPFYYDPKGNILLLETILNSKPLPLLPNHEQYLASFKKELKVCEAKTVKSSVDEPPEVELKDLPHHLEYAFLESDNKLPVIIAKELRDEEKSALIKVLKSHKRAIAWKLSDIQGEDNVHCPYGTFAYRPTPFDLCNAPGTFQRCMLAIFYDMVEKTMEVFMDDFLVFRNSFENCLSRLDKMLQRCEDTNLCLNWEKSHFMVKEGIVLGHNIFKNGIEIDKAKVDVITKLPHPITVKGVRSFLGHVGFYRLFIQDFSKISRPMTHLLEKNIPFIFSEDCIKAFQMLKKKLTEAPILIAPNWD